MRSRPRQFFALALIVVMLSACRSDSSDTVTHTGQDVDFAQMMIVHHQGAIDMANEADEKASTDQVKAMAGQIRTTQQTEITTMLGWLQEWGESTGSSVGHDHALDAETANALATATGIAYDQAWIQAMVAHHRSAITMAETEIAQGSYQPAIDLANTIITTQRQEIEQMQLISSQADAAEAAKNVEEVIP